jgi:predicted MPP superfamily phosphohydrolase
MSQAPLRPGDRPHLRLLLSHSPDQYAWARTYGFDLMLAGHNHGGQIVFPLLGPMAVPSRYGVKYACGVFYEAPTLLHVSRGISSELPLRLRCPPELALLELRRGAIATTAAPRDR